MDRRSSTPYLESCPGTYRQFYMPTPEITSIGIKVMPTDVSMTTALVVRTVIPSTGVTFVAPCTVDVSSVLVTLAPFLLSRGEQIQVLPTAFSTTTDALVVSAGASPSSSVEISQSPDSDDLIDFGIQILTKSLVKLFNQSVESALTMWKGLSTRTLVLLRNQLGLRTSIAGLARAELFKTMIDEVELQFQELQWLCAANVDGIAEPEFRQLSMKHREVEESVHKEMEQIKMRLQGLNDRLASVDG